MTARTKCGLVTVLNGKTALFTIPTPKIAANSETVPGTHAALVAVAEVARRPTALTCALTTTHNLTTAATIVTGTKIDFKAVDPTAGGNGGLAALAVAAQAPPPMAFGGPTIRNQPTLAWTT